MRGEHYEGNPVEALVQGSSPHARGTLGGQAQSGFLEGIIPACAGNTMAVRFSRMDVRDHPRMRGEHYHERGVSKS